MINILISFQELVILLSLVSEEGLIVPSRAMRRTKVIYKH